MKINELSRGMLVTTKNSGTGIVLDIGKFDIVYNTVDHEVLWRGVRIHTSGRWYAPSDAVATRRVVLLGLNGSMQALTAASIARPWNSDQIKEWILKDKVDRLTAAAREQYERATEDFRNAQRSLVHALVPTDNRRGAYYRNDSPFAPLAESDLIKQMLLLYLQYKLQRGEEIESLGDLEAAIETLRDTVRGQREADNTYKVRTENAQVIAREELGSDIEDPTLTIIKVTT